MRQTQRNTIDRTSDDQPLEIHLKPAKFSIILHRYNMSHTKETNINPENHVKTIIITRI